MHDTLRKPRKLSLAQGLHGSLDGWLETAQDLGLNPGSAAHGGCDQGTLVPYFRVAHPEHSGNYTDLAVSWGC